MNSQTPTKNSLLAGAHYLAQGMAMLLQPGMKRFVFIPIAANCIVFLILTISLFQHFSELQQWFSGLFPSWDWISYVVAFVTGLFVFFVLLVYGYSFTLLTNLIAAPFYGMLAEKIERHVTGEATPDEPIGSIIVRTLQRELVKLFYFVSRGLLVLFGLLLLSWIPLVQILVPLLAVLWGTWVMTLQYVDYPADNHQLPFTSLRGRLKTQRYSSISFGGIIMLGSMIPIVNIFVMPLAVAGGTLFWIHELRQDALESHVIESHGSKNHIIEGDVIESSVERKNQ